MCFVSVIGLLGQFDFVGDETQYPVHAFIQGEGVRVKVEIRLLRDIIWCVDACIVGDFALASHLIVAFYITLLTDFYRAIDMDEKEVILVVSISELLLDLVIRGNECAQTNGPGIHE